MSSNSFQNEIPRSRVNITLELDEADANKRTELPLKMLVLGDYSNGQSQGRVADRERVYVDRQNVESVINEFSPRVSYQVPNKLANDGSEIDVDLTFDSYDAFHPESVARNVPQINKMLAMRNLLKDLRSNLLDNGRFRRELETILSDQPQAQELLNELKRAAPLDGEVSEAGAAANEQAATVSAAPSDADSPTDQ
jgi:type VI secretion system protein ImpB